MGKSGGFDYWWRWQVPVCAFIIALPAVICGIWIKKKMKSNDPLGYGCLWIPCWKGLNPKWLLLYRALVFFTMAWLLYQMVVLDGLLAFYFYTQWTFALVMLYFAVGTIISAHGCWSYAERGSLKEEKDEFLNSEPEETSLPTTASFVTKEKASSILQKHERAGFLGYLMHTIYQISAGAVILTDIVFWCVLVPMESGGKGFKVTLLIGFIHSLNAVFLIMDSALNNLPFQWFGFTYFALWSVVYIVFQWVLHACGFTWWPYPFLELATPFAPLWYIGLAVFHVPCYGIYILLMKVKLALSKLFPHAIRNIQANVSGKM